MFTTKFALSVLLLMSSVFAVFAHDTSSSSVAPVATPRTMFAAGYDGWVRSVALDTDGTNFTLTEINKTNGCQTNPSWLALQRDQERLWCLDEGWVTGNGTLNSFDIEDDGASLVQTQRRNVSASPVQSTFFSSGDELVIAQYGGPPNSTIRGGLTFHDVNNDGALRGALNLTFEALEQPGPAPGQDVPRGHGVILNPTGQWLVVTDYGADKIRTFTVQNSIVYKGIELETPPGSAPRHAKFGKIGTNDYLFVVSENANTITTYNVSYSGGLLHLTPPSRVIDTFGGKASAEVLKKAKASEIQISLDNKFLMVTNRMDNSFPESDSLANYRINADGSLAFLQLVPVGGLSPRQFTLNKAGDLVLVAATASETITVLQRDPARA
ncbi:6-phosphogluconolactonase [Cyphellophora attinorum]|uniref:6-phosphogluconolactonase n=1 Tax=Cyphellophora attinorum TaxID=1664694 RepID=A0A0N0NIT9_9EURO|nr:6-phosphogluconolactonase [Phialophora attinorum]KPI35839.1 6-phosphogluconolactonase [Phialophora attinorum]